MAMNFHSPERLFDPSRNLFRLYNAYSIPNGHTRSISPVDFFPRHDFPTLVLRDLNIHQSASDPTHLLSGYDQFISALILTEHQLSCFHSSILPGSTPGSRSPPIIVLWYLICPLPILLCFHISPPGTPPSLQPVWITPLSQSFSPLRS